MILCVCICVRCLLSLFNSEAREFAIKWRCQQQPNRILINWKSSVFGVSVCEWERANVSFFLFFCHCHYDGIHNNNNSERENVTEQTSTQEASTRTSRTNEKKLTEKTINQINHLHTHHIHSQCQSPVPMVRLFPFTFRFVPTVEVTSIYIIHRHKVDTQFKH